MGRNRRSSLVIICFVFFVVGSQGGVGFGRGGATLGLIQATKLGLKGGAGVRVGCCKDLSMVALVREGRVGMCGRGSFVCEKRKRRQGRRGRGKSRNYVKLKATFYLILINDKLVSFVAVYIN